MTTDGLKRQEQCICVLVKKRDKIPSRIINSVTMYIIGIKGLNLVLIHPTKEEINSMNENLDK